MKIISIKFTVRCDWTSSIVVIYCNRTNNHYMTDMIVSLIVTNHKRGLRLRDNIFCDK